VGQSFRGGDDREFPPPNLNQAGYYFVHIIFFLPRRLEKVTLELQGLETLEYQMSRNLEALRERYQAAQFARTFKGKIFNIFGKLFTAYCITRIIGVRFPVLWRTLHFDNSLFHSQYTTSFSSTLGALPHPRPTRTYSRTYSLPFSPIYPRRHLAPRTSNTRTSPLSHGSSVWYLLD
jgi:hypothetical protein